jgi:frataxin-like iron-binding protein CyaY
MSVKVKFGADEYSLKSTWKASEEFDDLIGDPLQLALKLHATGEHVFSAKTTVLAVWIGLKASGEKFSKAEVGELCHTNGVINYLAAANAYLLSMVNNGPEDEEEEASEFDKKKR